ncbi:hypothetical protein [Kribbella sp. DT2]
MSAESADHVVFVVLCGFAASGGFATRTPGRELIAARKGAGTT